MNRFTFVSLVGLGSFAASACGGGSTADSDVVDTGGCFWVPATDGSPASCECAETRADFVDEPNRCPREFQSTADSPPGFSCLMSGNEQTCTCATYTCSGTEDECSCRFSGFNDLVGDCNQTEQRPTCCLQGFDEGRYACQCSSRQCRSSEMEVAACSKDGEPGFYSGDEDQFFGERIAAVDSCSTQVWLEPAEGAAAGSGTGAGGSSGSSSGSGGASSGTGGSSPAPTCEPSACNGTDCAGGFCCSSFCEDGACKTVCN